MGYNMPFGYQFPQPTQYYQPQPQFMPSPQINYSGFPQQNPQMGGMNYQHQIPQPNMMYPTDQGKKSGHKKKKDSKKKWKKW